MWKNLRLEAKTLSCTRGGRLIFKDLNFSVSGGEVLELRGPNGSGKSSLLRLLAGLNTPSAGSLKLNPPSETISEQAHYVGHHEAVKPALTVQQNLQFWQNFLGKTAAVPLGPFKLQQLADDQAMLLSEGQRRRLALSRLVAIKRPVWLLDEPTVGLDLTALADLRQVITEHLNSGGLVIAATHAELGLAKTQSLQFEARS